MWLSTRPWASSTGRAAPGPSWGHQVLVLGVGGCWTNGEPVVWDRRVLWPQGRSAELGLVVPWVLLCSLDTGSARLLSISFLLIPPAAALASSPCSCTAF